MGDVTGISWTDRTWSPWYGCTQVSMGEKGACEGCYARHMSETRFGRVVFGGPGRGEGTRDVRADSAWKEPLRWQREVAALERAWHAGPDGGMGRPYPYRPFVFPSMCDPFDNHPDLGRPRWRFFDLIRATPNLTWLLLTKRPGNIVRQFKDSLPFITEQGLDPAADLAARWPRNAAIGCTVVTQEEADRDVPKLLQAKVALNPAFAFLSMEPLLGPVDIREWLPTTVQMTQDWAGGRKIRADFARLDWVITGGETDQGQHKARPSNPQWFRDLRDQCAVAGVPFHFKQWGEWVSVSEVEGPGEFHEFEDFRTVRRAGKKRAGRTLDHVLHDARPVVA